MKYSKKSKGVDVVRRTIDVYVEDLQLLKQYTVSCSMRYGADRKN